MNEYKIKVLHIVNSNPSHGGPTSVVQQLNNSKNKKFILKILDSSKLNFFNSIFNKKLKRFINKFDIIHSHSFFHLASLIIMLKSINLSIPVVLTLHGNFNIWSLKQNSLIKKIYLIFFRRIIKNLTIHFLNLDEREEFKKISKYKKNFIFSNSLNIEELDFKIKNNNFKTVNKDLKILFLGRLHEKKGVNIALYSIKELINQNIKNVKFNIYGPSHKDFKAKIKNLINELQLNDYVKIYPASYGYEKYNILSDHDIFLLPSLDEADSVAIKESLLTETPVIISNNCKFNQINNQAGIVCNATKEEVSNAIKFFINNPNKIFEMGKYGREMVIDKYDIDKNIFILNNIYNSLYLRLNRSYDYDGYNFYE